MQTCTDRNMFHYSIINVNVIYQLCRNILHFGIKATFPIDRLDMLSLHHSLSIILLIPLSLSELLDVDINSRVGTVIHSPLEEGAGDTMVTSTVMLAREGPKFSQTQCLAMCRHLSIFEGSNEEEETLQKIILLSINYLNIT